MAHLIRCQLPLLLCSSIFLIFFLFWFYSQDHVFHFSSNLIISSHSHQKRQSIKFCVGKGKPNSNLYNIEKSLARARHAINKATQPQNFAWPKDGRFIPRGPIYRNPEAFYRSYIEMEKRFKIWPYKDGDTPLFHISAATNVYAIEGQFIDELENGNSTFVARHPDEAAVFFMPVGITYIVEYLNGLGLYNGHEAIVNVMKDYVSIISNKYSYWNRSNGVDHFYVGCHDWSPDVAAENSNVFKNIIRVICNANTTEGFDPVRDATLPELIIYRKRSRLGPPLLGLHEYNRSILAFFSGGSHGYIRAKLFEYWKGKDADIQVYEYLPKNLNYTEMMGRAKFCLCSSGYEVATPRVLESIYAGCVPVLISDGFVPPFSDVLDWTQFSVHIPVARIPEIKSILQGISSKELLRKQEMLMRVRRHFTLHRPAQPFDIFHMILHSVWLRRLNVRLPA